MEKISDAELKKRLTPEQYRVLREKGTEAPYSGKYVSKTADGMYHCAACGAALFSTDDQNVSTTPGLEGWPSFEKPENLENIELQPDNSLGMSRTEVICKKCGSHLGHVFDEATSKTGKHFCINSCALDLKKKT